MANFFAVEVECVWEGLLVEVGASGAEQVFLLHHQEVVGFVFEKSVEVGQRGNIVEVPGVKAGGGLFDVDIGQAAGAGLPSLDLLTQANVVREKLVRRMHRPGTNASRMNISVASRALMRLYGMRRLSTSRP